MDDAPVFSVQRRLDAPSAWRPTLTIVIDTEEEFDWNAPFDAGEIQVTNIARQVIAQDIFDRHGIVPTYLVDYPVASTRAARDVLQSIVRGGRCQIGAHLHPWVNPPHHGRIDGRHSYPGNLPPELEERKLAVLTELLADAFGVRPVSYRAGRYGIGQATAEILLRLGYAVDTSIVPYTDFSAHGGPDFSAIPPSPFMMPGGLIEVPLSVGFVGAFARWGAQLSRTLRGRFGRTLHLTGVASRLRLLERLRLTPEGHSLSELIRQTRAGLAAGTRLFMLTYHSSSLLPGATPYVGTSEELHHFVGTLERYCSWFLNRIGGQAATLRDVAGSLAELHP